MRASTAYFAGAGTVIIAMVAGMGGGLLIADMISPKSPKQATELTRLERRMSPEPIQAATGPSEPVQYLPTAQARNETIAAAPAQPRTQTESVNAGSTPAPPVETSAATQPPAQAPQPAPPQPAAQEQAAAPEDSFAKARDAEVKRAIEKRKAERRQQWAEKRRQRQQQELRAFEERVREETEPRQEFAAEPVRIEMPRMRLFGQE